jgi:hypothetical protein
MDWIFARTLFASSAGSLPALRTNRCMEASTCIVRLACRERKVERSLPYVCDYANDFSKRRLTVVATPQCEIVHGNAFADCVLVREELLSCLALMMITGGALLSSRSEKKRPFRREDLSVRK